MVAVLLRESPSARGDGDQRGPWPPGARRLHLPAPPIVAGIIAIAVGDDLLIAEPGTALHGVGLAMVLGGPALYLLAESLFRLRLTGAANAQRLAVAVILLLLAPIGAQISALALSATVATLLSALALWELRSPAPGGLTSDVPHPG